MPGSVHFRTEFSRNKEAVVHVRALGAAYFYIHREKSNGSPENNYRTCGEDVAALSSSLSADFARIS